MANSRDKGQRAEREVAELIQHWWRFLPVERQSTIDGNPCEFFRTPMSGGWGTAHARGNYRIAGDLATTSSSWPFTVEVKRREQWTLSMFVKGGKKGSPVWSWWAQTVKSAAEENAIPMLWMRRSRNPWIVLIPHNVGIRVMGALAADIMWLDETEVAHHNTTGVHPIGFVADKVLQSEPSSWIDLPTELIPTQ